MEKTAEVFFDHFGLRPGKTLKDIQKIAEFFGEVPWENLTKFIVKSSGDIQPRFTGEVLESFVTSGTGGTCFSLTEALGSIFSYCGLSVRPLTGHMRHGDNIHCALLVEGEAGRFIMDPGYVVPGAVMLSSDNSGKIETASRKMLWTPVAGGWELNTVENGQKQLRYKLEERVLSRDEFLKYWIRSFDSAGLNSLHLNKVGSLGGRLSAHNSNLRIVSSSGNKNVKLGKNYAQQISEAFGISLSVAEKAWLQLEEQREKMKREKYVIT